MKLKFTLSTLACALLFTSAASMAASTGTITQDGNHNKGYVTQADNDRTSAYISVVGDENKTTIEQSNNSDVTGKIYVKDWGYDNRSYIVTTNVQTGSAYIEQKSGKNTAGIDQGTKSFRSSDLHAVVSQSGGYDNDAWVEQTGKKHTGEIYQHGSDNYATIKQSSLGSSYGKNFALISQKGHDNDAHIVQKGSSLKANISQKGSRHQATITQYGKGHEALVQHTGYGNVAHISQR